MLFSSENVLAEFATLGGVSGCSCQTPSEVAQYPSCQMRCPYSFTIPYDSISAAYLTNVSYNITFYSSGAGTNDLYESNQTSFLDPDTIYNANDVKINQSQTSNPGGTFYYYYTHINRSFTSSMFNQASCSNWPYSCSWDLLLNTTTRFRRATGTVQINYTLNWLNYTWNYTPDTFKPNVSLINPQTNIWSASSTNYFYYNVSDEKDVLNCSLILNNVRNTTNTSIVKNIDLNFSRTLADGFYNWSVNCSDNTSYRNTGNSSKWLVKIDTTSPTVNLESPANNTQRTTSNKVIFKYNATDNLGNITCNLIVDLDAYTPIVNVSKNVSVNFSEVTLGNGLHNWTVNCTDEAGNYYTAAKFNLSIEYAGASVSSNYPTYELGDVVTILGVNWLANANISINLTKPNGVKISWNATVNDTGHFNTTYYLNYSETYGQFNITAINKELGSENSSTTFNVNQRMVYVSANNTIVEGQQITINGSGISPDSTVLINITSPSLITYNITTISNATGHFNSTWNVFYSGPPGVYTVYVWDYYFMNLNSTTTFTVTDRVANVSTDFLNYGQNSQVIINGSWYYPLNLVSVMIKNRDNQGTKTLSNESNAAGEIGTIWNTTDTCNGNYSVITQNDALTAETNFTITQATVDFNLTSLPYHVVGSAVSPLLSNVNVSDGNEQNLGVGSAGDYYLEFNYTNDLPSDAIINNITFINEHRINDLRIDSYKVFWFNGTALQQLCQSAPSLTKTNESCDMTLAINTPVESNEIRIRINYTKTGVPAAEAYVDFARIYINYSTPAPCTPWVNYPPEIVMQNFFLDDSQEDMERKIDLLAGITTNVYCNATVRDDNGWADIIGTNATMYLDGFQDGALDNSTKYFNSSCSCNYQNWQYAECVCAFDVWHYASNGTWYCNMTVWDSKNNVTSNVTNATINPNTYLNLTTDGALTLDFGNINPGENSTSSKIVNITNTGNSPINISVYAYANISGDNMSMMCENGAFWINTSYLRYNLTDKNWTDMFEVNNTFTPIDGLVIPKRTGAQAMMNSTYWRLLVPPATIGVCNGSLVFKASSV